MSSPYRPAAIFKDPYPAYDQLRKHDPVHYQPDFKIWLLTRHQDCVALFRDPRSLAGAERLGGMFTPLPETVQKQVDGLRRHLEGWALFADPPAHTRIRSLITKSFTNAVVEELRPTIEEITNELVDGFAGKREVDLISDFAISLPVTVIGALLGMPASDRHLLKKWSDDIALFIADPRRGEKEALRAHAAYEELRDYISSHIAARRRQRERDIVSYLIHAEENGSLLNDDEIISTVSVILFGGHETTTNLIGNGFLALFQNPEQLERLKKDDGLIPSAVEEFLRYDSPVQLMGRANREEMEIGGKMLPPGSRIIAVLGSANRDPEQFSDAEQLDIGRKNNRHIAFGFGPHFCIGAQLARVEAQIAFRTILSRFPKLQMSRQQLQWRPDLALRGLVSLKVTVD